MPSSDGVPGAEGPRFDLPEWIRAVVNLDPEAPALEFEGTWRSWRLLSSALVALDDELDGDGLGAGTMVGVVVRNRPEIVRAMVAVLGTGRCLVTLSSVIPTAALAAEVRSLALPVIVAGADDWTDELRAAAGAAESLGLVIGDDESGLRREVSPGRRHGAGRPQRPGVAVQMLTSGTTGPPKRVDLLYRSIEHEIAGTRHYSSTSTHGAPRLGTGVAILWSPLLHASGLRGLITNVVDGRRMALLERFDVTSWAALVQEHRPRAVSLVPSALRMVLDAKVPREALASVEAVVSGTAPLAPETAEEFEATYGIPVLVVYGATEFAGGVAGWTIRDWRDFHETKRGSVGRVNPGVQVRVVDQETDRVVTDGSVGLLELKGAQLASEEWVRTTDLGRIDEDGFIWIVGRADDVIIRGGFKVPTGAVADVLRAHPDVVEACVVGRPDARLGQVPVAAVEVRSGAPLTAEELRSWASEWLSGYQVPVEVRIVDQLPRTPSMKVSQHGVHAILDTPTG